MSVCWSLIKVTAKYQCLLDYQVVAERGEQSSGVGEESGTRRKFRL